MLQLVVEIRNFQAATLRVIHCLRDANLDDKLKPVGHLVLRCCFTEPTSKPNLQSKLKLSRIESRSWLSESSERCQTRSKSIVRNPEVCSIEKIETFGQQVQPNP